MKFFRRIFLWITVVLSLAIFLIAWAANSFLVKKIRIEGLHRISRDTVMSYLPIKAGDRLTGAQTAQIIRTLYQTGFFNNVDLTRINNTLVIKVQERATIGAISITGNKKITKKQLLDALKNAGFTEGQPYDNSVLANLKQALQEQYVSLGYYSVQVTTKVMPETQNRVNVAIQINEGAVAKIKDIKIVGNHAFKSKELLKNFSLTKKSWWHFWGGAGQYSKEKLDADLENLHSFYLDHGYLKFKVTATHVVMSKDKKHVYVVIQVNEGSVYTVSGFSVSGNLIGHTAEIKKLVTLEKGKPFSRQNIVEINNRIGQFFGDYGYAMPNIQTIPVLNDKTKQVFLKFIIHPGKRIYIRRITISGNTKTKEYVIRREMRQQEGGLFSLSKINESKRRLNNLGYLQNVDAKVEPVPGHPDQVDLHYNVKEAPSAGANLQVGYSDVDRFIIGASINEQNFLGTGKGIGINFNRSSYSTTYGLSYFDPYFTQNNISLGLSAYRQQTDTSKMNLSAYDTNAYGFTASFGVPLSDYNRINFGAGFEHLRISLNDGSSKEMQTFSKQYGDIFNSIKLLAGWKYSKLDRAIFPTEGAANSLNFEAGVPVSSKNKLQYYKITDDAVYYHPLLKYFVLRASGDLGYGNGYGGMKNLPYFKNYYAGGIGSVRGYETNTLGPLDSSNNPSGGNVLTDASLAIIFPNPLGPTVRTSAFVDAGNVFQNQFKLRDIRTSAGVQAEWRSPLGMVITFSLAAPLNAKKGDRKAAFQFNLGASI